MIDSSSGFLYHINNRRCIDRDRCIRCNCRILLDVDLFDYDLDDGDRINGDGRLRDDTDFFVN